MAMVLWTQNFMKSQDYGVFKHILYQDNMSAILLEKNDRKFVGKRSRHLHVRYFFIMDVVDRGKRTIGHCPTLEMIADYMTKPLQGQKFLEFRTKILGM